MAKAKSKEKEDFKTMSTDELNARLKEVQEEQFRLRFRHTSAPLKNPMQLRAKRRDVARLKTWLRQKEAKGS
jgi:large subunit ribosomal protein L29